MARQIGDIKITGTIGDITFYRMDGEYYARMKSSLTAKKVKTHPHFALTRMYAKWLGEASKLASEVYRTLPRAERKYTVFCRLKAVAHKLVKEGVVREEVLVVLRRHLEEMAGEPVKKGGAVVRKEVIRVVRITGRITTKARRDKGVRSEGREKGRRLVKGERRKREALRGSAAFAGGP
ncbi:MAG TPA: hypothetical protein VGB56_06485 [Flavisolibacter sp.]|jgi:hypothetical protein